MFAVWPFLLDILFITSAFAADFSGSVVSVLDGDTLKGLHNQRHRLPGERASLRQRAKQTSIGAVFIFS
jgi:hypothetical protein